MIYNNYLRVLWCKNHSVHKLFGDEMKNLKTQLA